MDQPKGPKKQTLAATGVVFLMIAALTGCSISVPSQSPPSIAPSAAPTSYAPPTIVPGHDAAAVAGAPMTFEAGKTLVPGVPVGFSDVLGQPPQEYSQTPGPPEWNLVKNNVAGQTQYTNAAGCQVAYWIATNQGPLITHGDDKSSTLELMKYLIPSVMEESLPEALLPWVAEAGKAGPLISFLSFGTKAGKDVMASTVWGRMLGSADTSLLVSLACPTDELLAATTPKVMAKLSVAPPSN
ncbi:hypothetical protein AAFM46_12310 [Arthrobacter sp. TMP15]|uniref:hypothetical protein n=1 Tax=Arthrobacter sp. TMP15 TaxID=3140789 RepID=UPI0031BB5EA4